MSRTLPAFARRFPDADRPLARIGEGALGGKAQGLVLARQALDARPEVWTGLELRVDVPALVVVGASAFEAFLERNDLEAVVREEPADERIAHAFLRADLPAEVLGDLHALAAAARRPLAVRSSSVLEDALGQPLAGVYGTKMLPGSQPDADARFRALVGAVKFVYASAFFAKARAHRRTGGLAARVEAMAVVVQEVVGHAHATRFYPDVSGVARSYNFYPVGPAWPDEGLVQLALGLGKTIVDGGLAWSFSPAHPRVAPPVASPAERLETTQTRFWAVHVGPPPRWDPMTETEYLVQAGLAEAEQDRVLGPLASTYDPRSDRLVPGIARAGPRVLDFAPLLAEEATLEALRRLLALCEAASDSGVEIEFALTLGPGATPRLGLLQVRPLVDLGQDVTVTDEEMRGARALLATSVALGHGEHLLSDVVFVEPGRFEARHTRAIAAEIEPLNRALLEAGRPYLLVGFGRWGSADPWLGIPVRWDQIAGARAIVEAARPELAPEPSQGSHFFHNLSSHGVGYLAVPLGAEREVDWDWLERQAVVARRPFVRHVRSAAPLRLKLDGRARRGVVLKPE